jgi:hypothetical protein
MEKNKNTPRAIPNNFHPSYTSYITQLDAVEMVVGLALEVCRRYVTVFVQVVKVVTQ